MEIALIVIGWFVSPFIAVGTIIGVGLLLQKVKEKNDRTK